MVFICKVYFLVIKRNNFFLNVRVFFVDLLYIVYDVFYVIIGIERRVLKGLRRFCCFLMNLWER